MLNVAIKAAKAASELLLDGFAQPNFADVDYKDAENIVTKTDKASEKSIISILSAAFPDHSIFSEEMGMLDKNSPYLWIVDPLDGTTNFSRKIPHFDISICLLKNNKPEVGVMLEPLTGDMYSAAAGQGATLNDKSISVNGAEELMKVVMALERGSNRPQKIRFSKIISHMINNVRSVRDFGSGPLGFCYVTSGKLDAFTSNGCHRHDFAAGALIAKEAGALVTDFMNTPLDWSNEVSDVLATNPKLHAQFIGLLKDL